MAGNPNPYRDAYPWNNVIIGGQLMPGVLTSIEGADKQEIWSYQYGLAVINGVSIWRGRKLAEDITIKSIVYDVKTFDACFMFRDTLRPNWKRPPVLPVMNGAFNFAGINRVGVKRIIPPVARPDKSWEFSVVVTEYNPMKPVPVGPPDAPKAETENDRLEKQFSALLAQAPSLFGH
jgi:hypothetical protein